MAEQLNLSATDKKARYEELLPQIEALCSEPNLTARSANVAAALRMAFGFFWVGFYWVEGQSLVLGAFQGDIACTRIAYGRGVCGSAWQRGEVLIVPDVDAFPGHIACSSLSRSEIVLPIYSEGQVLGVLDVDSDQLDDFDCTDAHYLGLITEMLKP